MQAWPQVKGAEGPGRLQGVQRGPECTLLCHRQLGHHTRVESLAADLVPTRNTALNNSHHPLALSSSSSSAVGHITTAATQPETSTTAAPTHPQQSPPYVDSLSPAHPLVCGGRQSSNKHGQLLGWCTGLGWAWQWVPVGHVHEGGRQTGTRQTGVNTYPARSLTTTA